MQKFIDYDFIKSFEVNKFKNNKPYPWFDFHQLLTPEGFKELYDNYPSLELFEKHNGLERNYGQRPHNRYYLALNDSIYKQEGVGKAIVTMKDLPVCWQNFIIETNESPEYLKFVKKMFGVDKFVIRYAWHIGVNNSEVSPHVDGKGKVGTHIFYFNTDQDWKKEWGGETLALGGKTVEGMSPDFPDFKEVFSAELMNNHSFLFQNTQNAWHGVKTLSCPEKTYRRLFNVIFEYVVEEEKASPLKSFKKLIKKVLN